MAVALEDVVRGAQAAFAEKPARALATFGAKSKLVSGVQCTARMRGHEIVIDEPRELGGADGGANPVELVLSALAACQIITYRFHAARLGIPLDDVAIDLEGDIDLRGFMAISDDVRPGFREIRGEVRVHSTATPEQLARLEEAVSRSCPVLDILCAPTPVRLSVAHIPATPAE